MKAEVPKEEMFLFVNVQWILQKEGRQTESKNGGWTEHSLGYAFEALESVLYWNLNSGMNI